MKTVQIPTVGRRKIEGTILMPAGRRIRRPAALFLHGWGSDRQRHLLPAQKLADMGFVSLAIDLRGHGKTRGLGASVSALDNLRDAKSAYDFLTARSSVDPRQIAVAGYSYGGFLAILLAAENKVRWLALRSPALYRDEDIEIPKAQIKRRGLMAFRRRLLTPADCVGLRAASNVESDVLVIEAANDRVIPHQQIRNYLNAFRRAKSVTYRLVRGADHAMSRDRWFHVAVDAFVEWVKLRRAERPHVEESELLLFSAAREQPDHD